MPTQTRTRALTPTLENRILGEVSNAVTLTEDRFREAKNYIRKEPVKSVAYAMAAGYLLRLLPIAIFVRIAVPVLLAMVRPAVIVFGALKAYSLFEKSDSD